jgi:hypothetical protein
MVEMVSRAFFHFPLIAVTLAMVAFCINRTYCLVADLIFYYRQRFDFSKDSGRNAYYGSRMFGSRPRRHSNFSRVFFVYPISILLSGYFSLHLIRELFSVFADR